MRRPPKGLNQHSDRGSQSGFKRSSQQSYFTALPSIGRELLQRGPAKRFSRSGVEGVGYSIQLLRRMTAQPCIKAQFCMLGHFGPLIPSQ